MKNNISAGDWMRESGNHWRKEKHPDGGGNAKRNGSKAIRVKRAKKLGGWKSRHHAKKYSVREFVESQRYARDSECIFVPGAQEGVPAATSFLGKVMVAARYMCLLTNGTPKYEGAVARHTCGNGHLSCVNPGHIKWGDVGDNISDASRHRKVGENIQDRINSVTR